MQDFFGYSLLISPPCSTTKDDRRKQNVRKMTQLKTVKGPLHCWRPVKLESEDSGLPWKDEETRRHDGGVSTAIRHRQTSTKFCVSGISVLKLEWLVLQ